MEADKDDDDRSGQGALRKQLGLIEAVSIVVGVVMGSGVFFKPTAVFRNAGSPGLGLLAWITGAIIVIASGLTIAEIASAIPRVGGLFAYIRELYGDAAAFLLGWVQILIYIPGSVAAIAIIFTSQMTYFLPMSMMNQRIFAIIIIGFLMALNVFSTKFGGRIQDISAAAKLLPIAILVIFGFIKGTHGGELNFASKGSSTSGFGAAVVGTLWAYDGWVNVGNVAEELKNPAKNLPRAIIIGLLISALSYLALNLAILRLLPFEKIITFHDPASEAAAAAFGRGGASLITIGILLAVFGALNAYILTGARVPLAMAQEGLLPFEGFFSYVNERFRTPSNSLLFQFVIASIYVLTGSFDALTDLVIFAIWVFFIMAVAGVFILRKHHKHLKRPYQVPLYPITPIIGIIGGMFIILDTFFSSTLNAIIGVAITLVGIPVYLMLKSGREERHW